MNDKNIAPQNLKLEVSDFDKKYFPKTFQENEKRKKYESLREETGSQFQKTSPVNQILRASKEA